VWTCVEHIREKCVRKYFDMKLLL